MTTEDRPLVDLASLSGRVAVVTGAAQGIGLAIAKRLREAGAVVVIADINADAAASAAAELGAGAGLASSGAIDVTKVEDHDRVAQEVVDRHGRLDIWVNNAGIFPTTLALDMTVEELRRVLAINVEGVFYGARAAARYMVGHGGGVVINIGSTSGFRATSDGRAHYAASKAAVRGLTKNLAREFGPHGVRVLCVAPVATVTPGTVASATRESGREGQKQTVDQFFEAYSSKLPLRRVATPDDIALAVCFCATDQASFITGITIPVDGGFLAV